MNNNLRRFREAKGLRQVDVADKLGFTSADRLSYWERGMSAPNIINLFRLTSYQNGRMVVPMGIQKLYKTIGSKFKNAIVS